MRNIKINFESLPTRCETCHQTDCFEPKVNQCSRCDNIKDETTLVKRKKIFLDYGDFGLIYGAICGAVIAILSQETQNYMVGKSLNLTEISYSMIIGLVLLCALWGAAIGETVKQSRKSDIKTKKKTKGFNLWKN